MDKARNRIEPMDADKTSPKAAWIWGITVSTILIIFFFTAGTLYEDEAAWKDALTTFLEQARGTPWALPIVCLAYVVGGAIFFPVILLNLVCALVFGLWGIVYALAGAMLNAAVYFGIGYYIRHRRGGKSWLTRPRVAPVDRMLQKSGLAGIVFIHSLPAPPFTVTNFIAGLSSVNFVTFFAGTFIALLPGAIARGIVGDSLTKILLHPQPETYAYLGLGIVLWIVMVAAMHWTLKRYTPHEKTAPVDRERF